MSREWRRLALGLYKKLPNKGEVLGDLGRGIVTLLGGDEPIGPDRLERFRQAINGAYKEEVLPPPFVTIDTRAEFAWLEMVDEIGDEAMVATARRWVEMMLEAHEVGALADGKIVDAIIKATEWRRMEKQSSDDLEAIRKDVALPEQLGSDGRDTTRHGKASDAPSGDGRNKR